MPCQRLWFLTLATYPSKLRLPGTPVTQGWETLNLLEVWIQNRRQSRVPHIWRALCARYGKPQISPLRCAPGRDDKLARVAAVPDVTLHRRQRIHYRNARRRMENKVCRRGRRIRLNVCKREGGTRPIDFCDGDGLNDAFPSNP